MSYTDSQCELRKGDLQSANVQYSCTGPRGNIGAYKTCWGIDTLVLMLFLSYNTYHSDGDVANVSFTPGWLCCAAIMTSIDTYAERSHHAAESLPSTSSGTFAHTGKTSLPPRSTSGSHSGTLPYSRAASMALSPRGRKGSFMSTAHSYATGAEREQAEAYFSDLLSYR